jgi:hypothetical protein
MDPGNQKSYPRTGTTCFDLSGNNTVITLSGSSVPVYSSSFKGVFSYASSSKQYIDVADSPQVKITGSISLCSWVLLSSVGTGNAGILGKFSGVPQNDRSYMVYHTTQINPKTFGFTINPDGTSPSNISVSGSTIPTLNRWYYVSATYVPSTNMILYVNAVRENIRTTSVPASIFNSSVPAWLGVQYDSLNGLYYLSGMIGQSLIYNRALSQAEIKYNYDATRGRYGL